MPDPERLVDLYCQAWFCPDPETRRSLLAQAVEQDVTYVDPTVSIVGIASLASHIDRVVEARPGFWLERTTVVDHHHDVLRFGWVQRGANGFRGAESIDVCRLSRQGKLADIIGFFGPLAAMPGSGLERHE